MRTDSAGKLGQAFCLLCSLLPLTSSSGGEVCLTMGLVAGGGCAGAVGCFSLGFSASPNHTLDPPQSGGWPCLLLVLEPLRSTSTSCLAKLYQDGKSVVLGGGASLWHNMGSHRAGAACTLTLLVGLAKHSASLSSVAHVPPVLGVKST